LTVAHHALLARLVSPGGEVIGDLSTATEVHLVRRLALEYAVRDPLVGLAHVELDQPLDGCQVVVRASFIPGSRASFAEERCGYLAQ
jgi:hypothetical protein